MSTSGPTRPRAARHAALLALALASSSLAATSTLVGCYGDEDDETNAVPRTPDYTPGDAAAPPPLAPGVRPAPDPTGTGEPPPPPPDGGAPDRTTPPQDAQPEAAPPEAGPTDAAGQ